MTGERSMWRRGFSPAIGARARNVWRFLLVVGFLAVTALLGDTARVNALQAESQQSAVYRPKLAVPEMIEPFLKYLEPGSDAFPAEREARELEARLRELGDSLRAGPARATALAERLLAPDFRGGRLLPVEKTTSNSQAPLEVRRTTLPKELSLDSRSFGAELRRLVEELREVTVAEFLVISIEGSRDSGLVRTDVRYDIVGVGKTAWRVEHVGVWRMGWRPGSSGWRVVEWTATSDLTSRAKSPVFTEVTEAALGSNDSFRRQLNIGLDAWMATLDSVLTRDSNGHHGVSVGDADGDGLEDFYVAQPAGLPNRLFRARGDSTFEDVTERAGLGVLDDTAQSLFADVDNDGDQDLVLATGTKPLALRQRRHRALLSCRGRLPVPAAAAGCADVDRDGRLRPRRLSRSLFMRLRVLLRRRRGQGRDADALPRRTQRTAWRPVPQRRARPVRRRHRRSRASTKRTTGITSPRPGPITTATDGPTCWWRTISARRTCIATAGREMDA